MFMPIASLAPRVSLRLAQSNPAVEQPAKRPPVQAKWSYAEPLDETSGSFYVPNYWRKA